MTVFRDVPGAADARMEGVREILGRFTGKSGRAEDHMAAMTEAREGFAIFGLRRGQAIRNGLIHFQHPAVIGIASDFFHHVRGGR